MFPFHRCTNRYTHANRTCPLHPYDKPQRTSELVLQPAPPSAAEDSEEVRRWLDNYRKERLEKTPGKCANASSVTEGAAVATAAAAAAAAAAAPSPSSESRQPVLATLEGRDRQHSTPAKKHKSTKRGLANELEQENAPQLQQQNHQQQQQQQPPQQPPYPHHISPRRLAGIPTRPLEPQRLMLVHSSPLQHRYHASSSSPSSSPSLRFPVIRSPVRSPLRRCILPRSPVRALMRPSNQHHHRSPISSSRSILEERLAMSSPVARRVPLDDGPPSTAMTTAMTPPSPLSSPARRQVPSSPVSRFPKKRWLKEAFQQQQQRSSRREGAPKQQPHNHRGNSDCEPSSEVLARPIRWGVEEEEEVAVHPAPKSLIVAAAALVELKEGGEGGGFKRRADEFDEEDEGVDDSQPLNLSLSSPVVKSG